MSRMLLCSAHATAGSATQPSCLQHCIKLRFKIKSTCIFKIVSIVVISYKNMCPSFTEGIFYAVCVAQSDVHHSWLQTLNRVNTQVPHLTPGVLGTPFASGREINSGETPLSDGCRHLSFTSRQSSSSYGAGKFVTNRPAPSVMEHTLFPGWILTSVHGIATWRKLWFILL